MEHEDPRQLAAADSDADIAEDVEQLLEDWGVTGGARKRKGRSRSGDVSIAHPGFLDAGRARNQHVSNLVAMMRHYESIGDDPSLARVLAVLLQSEVGQARLLH